MDPGSKYVMNSSKCTQEIVFAWWLHAQNCNFNRTLIYNLLFSVQVVHSKGGYQYRRLVYRYSVSAVTVVRDRSQIIQNDLYVVSGPQTYVYTAMYVLVVPPSQMKPCH